MIWSGSGHELPRVHWFVWLPHQSCNSLGKFVNLGPQLDELVLSSIDGLDDSVLELIGHGTEAGALEVV